MQDLNLEILIWLACICCNVFLGGIIIIQRKFQAKFKFKPFLVVFFGTLILITLFLNLLIYFTQDIGALIFEIIEIAVLQIFLLIFTKIIWHHDANLTLFIFSSVLFGIFRAFGMYTVAEIAFPKTFSQIAIYTAFFYQFFFIAFISLISIFVLITFNKILSRTLAYSSIFSLIWACLFIFGLTPFIDLLLYNLGIMPIFISQVYSFIGFGLGNFETYGTVFLYSFMAFVVICKGIFLGYKYRIKFMSETNLPFSKMAIKYIGIGVIVIIIFGMWYSFISLLDYSYSIILHITYILDFKYFELLLIHPFWLLMIIYGILLLMFYYFGYLIFVIVKKRENLWDSPNSFNIIPILNLGILVFSGFIFCYAKLKYIVLPYFGAYLYDSFILFVIYFYLIAFLLFLTLYILTFQKKPWIDFSYSLKIFLLFIPFFGGYFIAGQILNTTELFLGFISCASLQVYAVYLRRIKAYSFDFKHLNWFMVFFWGILSICLAGLLSISSLLCSLIVLILFYLINYQLKRTNTIMISYGLIGTSVLLMGGTSSTFFTAFFTLGIPSTFVFGSAFLIVIATIFYQLLQK